MGNLTNQIINDDYKMQQNLDKLNDLKLDFDIIIVDEC